MILMPIQASSHYIRELHLRVSEHYKVSVCASWVQQPFHEESLFMPRVLFTSAVEPITRVKIAESSQNCVCSTLVCF